MTKTTARKIHAEAKRFQSDVRAEHEGTGWIPAIDRCLISLWLLQMIPAKGIPAVDLAHELCIPVSRLSEYLAMLLATKRVQIVNGRYTVIEENHNNE